jgi:hypothetical protein
LADAPGICTIGYPVAGAVCVGALEIVRLVLDGELPQNMIFEDWSHYCILTESRNLKELSLLELHFKLSIKGYADSTKTFIINNISEFLYYLKCISRIWRIENSQYAANGKHIRSFFYLS